MYGMIHRAARQMMLENAGDAAWLRVSTRTRLEDDAFISAQVYSDEATFALIGAIADELNTPLPDLLVEFGRYWVSFAVKSPFSQIMMLAGDDLVTFLGNLDRMHASVKASMPGAVLPAFYLMSSDASRLTVSYRSPRSGLEPFVRGLLEGLLNHFGVEGVVDELGPSQNGVDFQIRYTV